jgi:Sap, sulfolipid-1-addressing protein
MGEVVGLAFTAAFNPTLLAATTVMLLLPRADRLLLGYWMGAMVTSITLGLVIVFTLHGSGFAEASKKTISPAGDLAIAGVLLIVILVLATGRDQRLEQRRARRHESKKPPSWQQRLSKGTAKTTFVVGALLSFPGVSYLIPRRPRPGQQAPLLDGRHGADRCRLQPGATRPARSPTRRVCGSPRTDPDLHRPWQGLGPTSLEEVRRLGPLGDRHVARRSRDHRDRLTTAHRNDRATVSDSAKPTVFAPAGYGY